MLHEKAIAISRSLFAALTIFGAGNVAFANETPSEPPSAGAYNAHEYTGLIVDQTITPLGQEFYQLFASLWRDKSNNDSYVLTVRERPSATFGSQVFIEYWQRPIFQAQLPTSRSRLKDFSEQAVEAAFDNASDLDIQTKLMRDADLAPDEI